MSKAQPFRKQGGGSEESFRAQSNVETAFGSIAKNVIIDGTLITASIGTSETLVEHKLGRAYRGYIICKNDQFSDIKALDNSDSTKFITLQASVACNVSLWVF